MVLPDPVYLEVGVGIALFDKPEAGKQFYCCARYQEDGLP